MEEIENIELQEIPVLKKKFTCKYCGKQYKTKSSYLKHEEKCLHNTNIDDADSCELNDNEKINIEEIVKVNSKALSREDLQLQKLRAELENLVLSNPNISLNNPISTTPLEAIKNMNIEELKARIFQAKRELNGKLDLKISDSTLTLVNMVVGKMLNCVDELNEEVMKDNLLRESTKDLLSFAVLSKIPPPIKVSGLYAVNVGVALQKSKQKNLNNNNKNEETV